MLAEPVEVRPRSRIGTILDTPVTILLVGISTVLVAFLFPRFGGAQSSKRESIAMLTFKTQMSSSYALRAVQVPLQVGDFQRPRPVLAASAPVARTTSMRRMSLPLLSTAPRAMAPK